MKVGVVVVTHYGLWREFVQSVNQIVSSPPEFRTVSIYPAQSVDDMRNAIAKELAVLLGGRIALKSSPGHGAVFSLHLPLDGSEALGARDASHRRQ